MESRLSSDRLGPVETLRIDYRHRRTFTVETTEGDGFSYTGVYAEALEIDRDGMLTGIKMRCEHSKLTTVRALQSIGYETIASGDSYNDLEMILASKAGFLFRSTDKIKADYPQLPAFETYDELLNGIKAAMA